MPIVQEIWIINSTGVVLFNLQLAGGPLKFELLGGFIAALEQFSEILEQAGVKHVIVGPIRFSLGPLGIANLIIAVRTDSTDSEKKVHKIWVELREKLRSNFIKKWKFNPDHPELSNVGFSLEFDEEINDIFLNL